MNSTIIIAIIVLCVLAIATGAKLYFTKKKDGDIDINDILSDYADQIIELSVNIITVMKMDRSDYDSEDEFKEAVAGKVAIEIKNLIKDSNLSEAAKNTLTLEIISGFVLTIFSTYEDLTTDLSIEPTPADEEAKIVEPPTEEEIDEVVEDNTKIDTNQNTTNIDSQLSDFYK